MDTINSRLVWVIYLDLIARGKMKVVGKQLSVRVCLESMKLHIQYPEI